ncbi:MAG TPA: sensor histidine kinase [Chitinophagaceae bacterium]|nr:sensor histidine kinase [Chitinophagaceae bacterium]
MSNTYYLIIIGMGVTFLLALSVVGFYVLYQRRFLKQQLELKKAELKHQEELLHATIQSQEDERRRIGRDLHDGVGSLLSNLRMNINRLNTTVGNEPAVNGMATHCSTLIDKTITDVRAIAHSLSPPGLELFGLGGALEELSDSINQSGALRVAIRDDYGHLQQLPPNVSLSLYRVLQELLSNTLKHANASTTAIHFFERDGMLEINYSDDGKGFTTFPTTGMGMRNVESRLGMINASYNISSSPGQGFSATIKVSL